MRTRLVILCAIAATGCMVGDPSSPIDVPDSVFDPSTQDDVFVVGDEPELEPDAPAIDLDTEEPDVEIATLAAATSNVDRATAAWHGLTSQMKIATTPGLFHDSTNPSAGEVSVWGLGQVIAGALDRAELSGHYHDVGRAFQA